RQRPRRPVEVRPPRRVRGRRAVGILRRPHRRAGWAARGGHLGLNCPKETFVATATATALVVDAVRLPIYLVTRSCAVPQVIVASGWSSALATGSKAARRCHGTRGCCCLQQEAQWRPRSASSPPAAPADTG